MTQVRDVINLGNPQTITELVNILTPLLNHFTDRLDRSEGLRGTPRFYSSTFDFPIANLNIGSIFRAISSNQATVSGLDGKDVITGIIDPSHISAIPEIQQLMKGLFTIYDQWETAIHQFPFTDIAELCEVNGFLQIDPGIWNPANFSVVPIEGILVGIHDYNDYLIHEFPLDYMIGFSEVNGFTVSDTLQIWNSGGLLNGEMYGALQEIFDFNGTMIHQFSVDLLSQISDTLGFY